MSFKPLLTQIKPTYFSFDCGMSYVIRTSDGKFIIIDSCYGEYDEPKKLIELLNSQAPQGETPTVAAWFFTHPHNDHMGAFIKLCDFGNDVIKIEKVYYSFPEYDWCAKTCKIDDFYAAIDFFGAETVTPKTGDVIKISDAVFHVIYTAPDCPEGTSNINETSLVMKMNLGKYSIMWLADIQEVGSEVLLKKYPKDFFKCDILQVGHHGYWGGSDELYRLTDPEYLLWPVPETRYLESLDFPTNSYLKNSKKIKEIFVSGIEEITIDMSEPIPSAYRYEKSKIIANFVKHSVSELNWQCVWGGSLGYDSVLVSFEDKICKIKSKERHSLLQIIQRGQVAVSEKCKLHLKAKITEHCEEFGIMPDIIKPVDFTSIEHYPVEYRLNEEFTLDLYIDRSLGIAKLSFGDVEKEIKLKTKEPCPLIIYIKGGAMEFHETVFENL